MNPHGCLDYFIYSQDRVPSVDSTRQLGIHKPCPCDSEASKTVAEYTTQMSKRKIYSETKKVNSSLLPLHVGYQSLKESNRRVEMNFNS